MKSLKRIQFLIDKHIFRIERSLSTNHVEVFEVGPRDGLQNISSYVETDVKVGLINKLSCTGIKFIEATSFVSPKWIPQFGDSAEVIQRINKKNDVTYSAFCPNMIGMNKAIHGGLRHISAFVSASEAFSFKNVNCSPQESLKIIESMLATAKAVGLGMRVYISCVISCPYQGYTETHKVLQLAKDLLSMGCSQISLGDTIGVGVPKHWKDLLTLLLSNGIPLDALALHCHNTYGHASACIYQGLTMGIRKFDSSIAGLGGCPYAKGASGNFSTEDLVYLLNHSGMETGIDLEKLLEVNRFVVQNIPVDNRSFVALANGNVSAYSKGEGY